MITKISFENYKAFEKGEIKIRPITILLGANSVGKSSILQLILMLQQTALSHKYKSALKLHGEFVSLGENKNIFRNKNTSSDLVLSFEFRDRELFSSFQGEYLEQLTYSLLRPLNMMQSYLFHNTDEEQLKKSLYKRRNREIRKEAWASKEEFLKILELLNESTKTIRKKGDKIENEFLFVDEIGSVLTSVKDEDIKKNRLNYGNLYDLLKSIQNIKSDIFELSFHIKNVNTSYDDLLKVSQIKLINESKVILGFSFEIDCKKNKYKSLNMESDFIDVKEIFDEKTKNELLNSINYDSTLFYLFENTGRDIYSNVSERNNPLINSLSAIFSNSISNLLNNFRREYINYVSPLRAHPKRYYFLDKAKINTFLDTLDGDSLTEILKENEAIRNKVNKWLDKFGLFVDVSTLQDIIHKLTVRQNDLSLDITDVGFGISQVLPVIVQGFLSYPKSLTIIEQPEIHLHPKMQADLADLLIDIVMTTKKQYSKYLLIETHSEYMLKRLRRRMAESKKISSDDVAIYFIHPKEKGKSAIIDEKIISSGGAFEWPKDFYSGELLNDTVEFIKNQGY